MRHGRSRADDEQVCEGRYDSPLTDVGRKQVQARAEEWQAAGATFDCIIASTLVRAAETAEIVGRTLNLEVETDPDWMERDNGPVAGLPFAVARSRYPVPAFRGPFDPYIASAGQGESEWAMHGRAALALEKVVCRGPDTYLVVAHGGILNAAMRCIVGAQPPVNGQGIHFAFGDAGYARTSYNPANHVWTLREFNSAQ